MTTIEEIKDGIREKGIERAAGVQKIWSDIERKRKEIGAYVKKRRKEVKIL